MSSLPSLTLARAGRRSTSPSIEELTRYRDDLAARIRCAVEGGPLHHTFEAMLTDLAHVDDRLSQMRSEQKRRWWFRVALERIRILCSAGSPHELRVGARDPLPL